MEHIQEFFDSSTIHGLSRISSTKKLSRLFWVLVVLGGFCGAGYLIQESFLNWDQSPISTTVETLSMSQITFPNITVCSPKNLFLNLNFDILQSNDAKLGNDTQIDLLNQSLDIVQEEFHYEMKKNLSKVVEPDRYYNWYHGYTKLKYPYYSYENELFFSVSTTLTRGNISTQYFGNKFDLAKLERNIYIPIYVFVPESLKNENASTIILNIEKTAMEGDSNFDKIIFNEGDAIDSKLTLWNKNISPGFPTTRCIGCYLFELQRDVSKNEILDMTLPRMPGFTLTWNYDKQLEPMAIFSNDAITKEFVRYDQLKSRSSNI